MMNRFLGVHFDFHATAACTEIGRDVTAPLVSHVLDLVQPDYVQCDCKGHPGLASYPTNVGTRAPGFVRDPLRVWRDVTAARDVGLYVHYSGLWDDAAAAAHPEWALDEHVLSVRSPYAEELLVPQLHEVREHYGVDGAWVDGDCWAARVEPPGLDETRAGFRTYLRRYVDALHAHDRDFAVASNWAFSSYMPEPVSAGVDFLSGDVKMLDDARLDARYLRHQGKPWDLMAWSFVLGDDGSVARWKNARELQREAAVVLAHGGGFQAYFPQRADGSVDLELLEPMREVARFCRELEPLVRGWMPVPQVALLHSSRAFYRKLPRPFGPAGPELAPVRHALGALLARRHVVDVVSEHHLRGRAHEWPAIVVPEPDELDDALREELAAHPCAVDDTRLVHERVKPLVSVRGPGDVDVSLARHRDRLAVHLVNVGAGMVGPFEVEVGGRTHELRAFDVHEAVVIERFFA
jgi:hypothetical protein